MGALVKRGVRLDLAVLALAACAVRFAVEKSFIIGSSVTLCGFCAFPWADQAAGSEGGAGGD